MTDELDQCFHVVSRVVARELIFGDEEKDVFLQMIRCHEGFAGAQLLSWCLMGNHFHMLVYMPARPDEISVKEVRKRMKCIYSTKKIAGMDKLIEEKKKEGDNQYEKDFYNGMRARMYNLSSFIQEVKQKFSKWYNHKNDRKGTLWEERFKSVLVQDSPNALVHIAAYIDLNPVRAGLVQHPSEYQWSSWRDAQEGGSRARNAIIRILSSRSATKSWEEAEKEYLGYLEHKMNEDKERRTPEPHRKDGEGTKEAAHNFSEKQSFLKRIKSFTCGYILGGRDFVESEYRRRCDQLNPERKKICHRMTGDGEGSLFTYRNAG